MLTQIEFTINRAELIEVLNFLSPFIIIQKKEYDDNEVDTEIMLPEPFFYDKVTFLLYKTHACLSVLTKEGVRVERTCKVDSILEDISFCMPHAYLLQEIIKHEAIDYVLKEDRFFGFNVFDSISGKHLFDVDAHSVSKQPSIHPKSYDTLYSKTFGLEHETLLTVLREFPKYTCEDLIKPFCESIWFFINDGLCRVVATTGSSFRQELFQTKTTGNFVFSIPGKFAGKLYDIIVKWTEHPYLQIGYYDTFLSLHNNIKKSGFGETIEVLLNKSQLPDVHKIISNHNITHRSSLHLNDLKSSFKMMNTIRYKEEYVVMHFFPGHVNIHCQDTFEDRMVNEFYDTEECDSEYTLKLRQKTLDIILDEIYTDKVIFTLIDDYLLYINNDDETLFGDVVRIICTAKMCEDDWLLLERGDSCLRSHSGYIEKYFTKYEEREEALIEDNIASVGEMKTEAICRMKEIIDYTDIIDYFEETGLPQVYEPPFGASYSLEDGELENVRNIESSRHVLVWGVIRCNMLYNRKEVTVDCMLHVSQNKNEWEQERDDLRNGMPCVYTVMKEYPVIDNGHINVYKSEGGTLLRK